MIFLVCVMEATECGERYVTSRYGHFASLCKKYTRTCSVYSIFLLDILENIIK